MHRNNEKLNRFAKLLQSIFELDKADLDFGIYRIMNIRKAEIQKFLAVDLAQKVQETLAPFVSDADAITGRIQEIEKQIAGIGFNIATSKLADEYARLKSQLVARVDLSSLETDVYSALYSFFNRYYDDGDFISKRRYKEGVYAIPYEGEEVKLYWANADQYYIKTAENFRDYTFIDAGKKVHFRLVDATCEKNNNKESDTSKRVFMLYTETPDKPGLKTIEEVDGELVIRFVHDVHVDARRKYAEENLAAISAAITHGFENWHHLFAPASQARDEKRSILEKHLTAYVAKNTFDYFIHKDLRGFLTRELDSFIKSEVIYLDDLDTTDEKLADNYLAKVRAIKRVGEIIIYFLAQIEDFQKKLWLKKKFIVATNWCITLDRIDENFYSEIIANTAQIAEWAEMYAIDEIAGDLTTAIYSEPLAAGFLRQNGNLVLDTRHFTADFKDRLIASMDNLDERTGGVLVHSENFQALRLLQERYREQVKCVYIDPPYNSEQDRSKGNFIYKDTFEHSSWLAMIYEITLSAIELLRSDGLLYTSIDDNEVHRLREVYESIFGSENFEGHIHWRRRHNQPNDKTKLLGLVAEHILVYAKKSQSLKASGIGKLDITGNFTNPDNDTRGEWASKPWKAGSDQSGSRYTIITPKGAALDEEWMGEKATYQELLTDNRIIFPRGGDGMPRKKYFKSEREEEGQSATNWWEHYQFGHNQGANDCMTGLFGEKNLFSNPKPMELVRGVVKLSHDKERNVILDYFAGSGTTGHAVLNLNREDNGSRKYILVEMGEYFNTVTLPRMKKVVYSADWKNGKPANRSTGVSHLMKYITLESYEDALSNVTLDDKKHELVNLFGEDYLIHYMLGAEGNLLDLDAFANPFRYKLKINENNETKEKVIDICETFNYLLGLSVKRQSAIAAFNAVADPNGEYEGAVRLEQDNGGEYGFRQIEGKLPDGKCALVIWRTVTTDLLKSNAALDAYFLKHRVNPADREFDVIYVNGDNNLENLRPDDETWKVQRMEPVFKAKMFEEAE
ncbi:MAG: site-specific DNA-methyltransferase [Candidatus Accumulibacter sp.]|nr:site-specific DNA-methyltransferase [Accumulibacter sp.]